MSIFYGNNEKSDTRSFTIRLDTKILKNLKSYAKKENSSTNSVINQLLTQAVDWDISAARAGWVPVPKSILVEVLNRLSDEELNNISKKQVKTVLHDMLLTMRSGDTVADWISIIRSRAKASNFHYTEIDETNYIQIVLRHDLGQKFSCYLKAFQKNAFNELGCKVRTKHTSNTLSLIIDKNYLDYNEKNTVV